MLTKTTLQSTKWLTIILLATLSIISCKKDKLRWDKVEKIDSKTSDRLNDVYFIDNNIGFVVGGDRFQRTTILRTTDGGNTWKHYDYPEAGKGIYGINAAPNGKLYAVGYDGKMLSSTDKGDSWQFIQLSLWKEFKDAGYFSTNKGLIIGGVSFRAGYLLHVDANGQVNKWDSLGYELNDLAIANSTTAYISGYGVLQKTTDGGQNWEVQSPVNENFTAIHLRNEQELWLCGIAGSIYHTTDGGANWERYRNGNDITQIKYKLLDIYFTDGLQGWAVGEGGIVIYSDDGGKHWSLYDSFTTATLRSVTQAPDGTIIVVGDYGSIYKLHP